MKKHQFYHFRFDLSVSWNSNENERIQRTVCVLMMMCALTRKFCWYILWLSGVTPSSSPLWLIQNISMCNSMFSWSIHTDCGWRPPPPTQSHTKNVNSNSGECRKSASESKSMLMRTINHLNIIRKKSFKKKKNARKTEWMSEWATEKWKILRAMGWFNTTEQVLSSNWVFLLLVPRAFMFHLICYDLNCSRF